MTTDLDALFARVQNSHIAYWDTLGIRLERVEAVGRVVLSLPMRVELSNRADVMHGGAITSLIDCAAGSAVRTLRTDDDDSWLGQSTIDLNVTFLNAASTDVTAEATILRHGRTVAFAAVDVRNASGDLVAIGRATYAIARRR